MERLVLVTLSDYNGFPGKMREAVGRRMTKRWNSGESARPSVCAACGQTEGAIHGHNEDYSTEDVYLPLCITCHLMLHMRFHHADLWELYKKAVRHGFRGEPLEQRNALYAIKQRYDVRRPESFPGEYINDERSATVLDMICPIKIIHPNAPVG